jgi:hypothetical protein
VPEEPPEELWDDPEELCDDPEDTEEPDVD